MDRHLQPGNVFEDTVIGGRLPPRVVLRLQAVNRDGEIQVGQRRPLEGNRTNGARDNLCMDASRRQPWQDLGQLAVAHERFTTDDRHVKGTVLVDEREESPHELIPAVVAELTKVDRISEVVARVRVAPRTRQRTLPCDLDRQDRQVASKDLTPSAEESIHGGGVRTLAVSTSL